MSVAWQHQARPNGGPQRDPVSLCGIGAVTGYGWGHKLLVEGLLSGESAVRPTPGFSPHFEDDVAWVARIEDEGDPEDGPSRYHRAVRFAARQAVHDALDRGWRPGPVVGTVHGYVLADVDAWRAYHHRGGLHATKREWMSLMPSTVLSMIAQEFGFHGPTMGVTAMCASGVAGIVTAQMWINAGMADDVLVIMSDISLTPENCAAFAKVGVLFVDGPSMDLCRPFQEGSRGFTAGEAAVAFVVSRRPGGSYATVLGGAMTHDGYHAIHIAPDHTQVFAAFVGAIEHSGVHPSEIAYVNAHGPGTQQCDSAEAAVFDAMFPNAEGIFSVKPLSGHCQGAAGAVELCASLYGLERGVIPAPPRVAKGHPRLLDGPTACVEGPVVKSSLGMGGHNAVMVLEAAAR
ncbi:MAG TPA: beta-ketoacyl synthase N-terminal-like domain-containing protein [Acidimicrobiales bacterium]|nr:beta-ketoacyl synthase N-terminal-like domain-containing protein [Acidimicrobiales bacterium]